jgi:hypothetical protein
MAHSQREHVILNAGHLGLETWCQSESQNNPFSTSGVNSAMTQSVRILRKIKKTWKAV